MTCSLARRSNRALELTNAGDFGSGGSLALAANLAESGHDSRVFDYLLECLRPAVLFVHGNTAVKHVSRLVGESLPLGEFVRVSYRGVSFDAIAGYHLSYQWSYTKVETLGRELADRCRHSIQDA